MYNFFEVKGCWDCWRLQTAANYWTMDSWDGCLTGLPNNWEELAEEANRLIDEGADSNELWDIYCATGKVGKVAEEI